MGSFDDSKGSYDDSKSNYDDTKSNYDDTKSNYDDSKSIHDDIDIDTIDTSHPAYIDFLTIDQSTFHSTHDYQLLLALKQYRSQYHNVAEASQVNELQLTPLRDMVQSYDKRSAILTRVIATLKIQLGLLRGFLNNLSTTRFHIITPGEELYRIYGELHGLGIAIKIHQEEGEQSLYSYSTNQSNQPNDSKNNNKKNGTKNNTNDKKNNNNNNNNNKNNESCDDLLTRRSKCIMTTKQPPSLLQSITSLNPPSS